MIGSILGHYRIVRSLGRGGMGEVYAAEDTKLNRTVALKVLPPATGDNPDRLKRFQREAQAVAALNHPNVVTIYSVEEADGVPFLTMELVDGSPLDGRIPRRGMELGALLQLAVPLADAVGAAHDRGVVHRDLKPSNVMVARDGRLKVLDFGLAKLKADHPGAPEASAVTIEKLTSEHTVLGTAAYMSPEQAEGRVVDQRSDIFSLGILLYQMATGTPPFAGDTPMSVLSSIIKDTPAEPAAVNPGISPDLARIIRRCLAKDPSRRYQSAIDLRNDLEELSHSVPSRRGRAIGARATLAVSGIAIAAIAVAAVAIWRGREERAGPATFTRLTSMPGREWFPSLSPDGKWVVFGAETEGNFDVFLQSTSSSSNAVNLTKDSPDDDDMPAFSPDGERIAFRSSREGGGLFVMGRTGEAVKRLTRAGFNPAWSPDGIQIAFTSIRMDVNPQNSEGESELWVVAASGGEPRRLLEGDAVQPSWSPHGKRIAFCKRGESPRRTDIFTIPVGGGVPTRLTDDNPIDWNPIWAPDGRHLYFVSDRSGTMNLWRIAVDEDSGTPRGAPEPVVTPAAFVAHPTISADGRLIAYGDVHRVTNIQRLALDPRTASLVGEPAWITTGSRSWSDPDPSPDGQFVVYYSQIEPEGDLYVSRADGTGQRQLTGDAALDRIPHWSPDGRWISAFSNRSGRLQLWKIRPDGSDLQQMTDAPDAGAAYSTWSQDGRRFAFRTGLGAGASAAFIIDPDRRLTEQTPEKLPPVPDSQFPFTPNSWSPDGARLAGFTGPTSPSAGIVVYSLKSRTYERLTNFGEWPVWLPDSRRILFGDGGRHFWVLDTTTKETKSVFSGGRDVLGPPRLTPDGRMAVYSRRVTESDVHLMTLK